MISCLVGKKELALIYAFHKKTQALTEKDKKEIKQQVKEVQDE